MFAVIRTGGKQYRVASGDVITVEKLEGDVGASVTLGEVLLAGEGGDAKLGKSLSGAAVTAEIVEQRLGEKVIIFKKRRRHNYRRKRGHRQPETVLRVTGIDAGA
jgi:large subunit ribosomal protein L21